MRKIIHLLKSDNILILENCCFIIIEIILNNLETIGGAEMISYLLEENTIFLIFEILPLKV